MDSDYDSILYEVDDPVATVTLNRPDRMNAWTTSMGREVHDAVQRANADRRVVGIVITGAGRAFCAGADLKDLDLRDLEKQLSSRDTSDEPSQPSPGLAGAFSYFMESPKPVIAALNGPAAGMGAVISLWTDLRFLADRAFVTMSFSQRGTVAEAGSSWLLPRLVGSAAAFDLLVSSRRVASQEALSMGLANAVVAGDELLATVRQYVIDLAATCSPTSMAMIKQQIYEELHDGLSNSSKRSATALARAIDGPDIQEGWKSYLEKRPPQFARIGHD